MSAKPLMFLTSALASAGLVIEPAAAAANGLSQLGTWGLPQHAGKTVSNLTCDGTPGVGSNILQMNVPRVPGANTGNAFRPNINAGASVPTGNTGFSRPMSVFNYNNDNSGAAAGQSIEASSRAYFGKPLNIYGGAATAMPRRASSAIAEGATSPPPAAAPAASRTSQPMAARARRSTRRRGRPEPRGGRLQLHHDRRTAERGCRRGRSQGARAASVGHEPARRCRPGWLMRPQYRIKILAP